MKPGTELLCSNYVIANLFRMYLFEISGTICECTIAHHVRDSLVKVLHQKPDSVFTSVGAVHIDDMRAIYEGLMSFINRPQSIRLLWYRAHRSYTLTEAHWTSMSISFQFSSTA